MKTDIIVVGGGHAGIEAANISAKKHLSVLLITGNIDLIGHMSCNPSIGGISKGNIVREIDALGGLMGKIIDQTGIHFKMLNRSKGIAVWGNRAQADKELYRKKAKESLEKQENISLLQAFVKKVIIKKNCVKGVLLDSGEVIECSAVILAMGTFLNGIIHIGLHSFEAGRIGEPSSKDLTEDLIKNGIQHGRLKTGTSPRIDGRTIDFSKFIEQKGDDHPWPFSFTTETKLKNSAVCYTGKTEHATHEIILKNLKRSPLYTGKISSIGPRYCPSIEDKIVRFGERDGHTLFLEPESSDYKEIYINGISTSLPFDVQIEIVNSIPGLEKAKILRPGYGIEYDYFPPNQLKNTLESKKIKNLFFAGQINGTSGYEEAGAQGIVAGINAVQNLRGENNLILGRETSYTGVLIDDLIVKGTEEPYRMFTSRAEYRLLLRQDNGDERLMPIAYALGFLEKEIFEKRKEIWHKRSKEIKKLKETKVFTFKEDNKIGTKLYNLLKRPEYSIKKIEEEFQYTIDEDEIFKTSIEADIKYKGFEDKEKEKIKSIQKMYSSQIPRKIDYKCIDGILIESRNKLEKIKPETIGQASRIPGITPSDITALAIYISTHQKSVSRETKGSNQ
jgi:tRNA uridine 5-carboxymethylaminomethyl modification enzyme